MEEYNLNSTQRHSNSNSSRRSSRSNNSAEWEYGWRINFAALEEDWWDLDAVSDTTTTALLARFDKFTEWLSQRPEQRIIVVAHKGVFSRMVGRIFTNCEVRMYFLQTTRISKHQYKYEYKEGENVAPMKVDTGRAMLKDIGGGSSNEDVGRGDAGRALFRALMAEIRVDSNET